MEISNSLICQINDFTQNYYNFTLKSATYYEGADFCVIEIFYRDGVLLSKEQRDNLTEKILEILPGKIKYEIKFIKQFVSEKRVYEDISRFLCDDYSSVVFSIDEIVKNELNFSICLSVDKLAYDYVTQKNLGKVIEKKLLSLYGDYTFSFVIKEADLVTKSEEQLLRENYREEEVDIYKHRVINYTDAALLVGQPFEGPAKYIVDKTAPEENVVVCGKITNKKDIVLKKKPKENDTADAEEPESVDPETEDDGKYRKKLYKWALEDFTGKIMCTILSTKETQITLEKLSDGDSVAIFGSLVNDKFTNSLVINVKSIQSCTIPENLVEYIEYRKEKPFYEFVTPEKIETYRQDDLLSFENVRVTPEILKDKTFVCFDFETTGLHFDQGDRIVEVGAVKIENGVITEKFDSYVCPDGRHIDSGASATTGIYDEDVKDAPKDYEVLQDFYKFTRGATLIGYNNINFDNLFLYGQAKKCRFNFDNPVEDVFRFAQKYVTGVKNYKLGTIAQKLGVTLDNAHNAYCDALATAEVFIKIAETSNL